MPSPEQSSGPMSPDPPALSQPLLSWQHRPPPHHRAQNTMVELRGCEHCLAPTAQAVAGHTADSGLWLPDSLQQSLQVGHGGCHHKGCLSRLSGKSAQGQGWRGPLSPPIPLFPPLLGPATWPIPSPEGQRTAVLSLKDRFSLQLEFSVANSLVFAICQLGSSPQVTLLLSPGILLSWGLSDSKNRCEDATGQKEIMMRQW